MSAGVVDEDVDAAEVLERLADHRCDLVVVADVDGKGERAGADRFDLCGGFFQWLGTASGDDDVGAGAGEIERGGAADAGAAAGHQGDRAAVDVGTQNLAGSAFRIVDLTQSIASRVSD